MRTLFRSLLAIVCPILFLSCDSAVTVDEPDPCEGVVVEAVIESPSDGVCIMPGESLSFLSGGNCEAGSWYASKATLPSGAPPVMGDELDLGPVTFPAKGVFLVTFSGWASGPECSDYDRITIYVKDDCSPVTVTIDTPANDVVVEQGQSVDFSGTVAGGDAPYTHSWSFGLDSGIADAAVEDPGPKPFDNLGVFAVIYRATDAVGDAREDTVTVTVVVPGSGLADGPVSSRLTKSDGIQLIEGANWAGISADYLLLLSGFEGSIGVDLESGLELLSDFFLDYSENLGAIALGSGRRNHLGDALFEFSNGGGRLTAYDATAGEWGLSQWLVTADGCLDAVPFGNDPASGGFVYTKRFGAVGFVEYDEGLDAWTVGDVYHAAQFPSLFQRMVSAFARTATGSVLVVEDGTPGELYKHDRSVGTSVTPLGDSPRRIRCLGDVCVVTNFGSDDITVLLWDESDECEVVGTYSVGEGPIGMDLMLLPNDDIAILTTGFDDDTFTITVVTPAGLLVSSTTQTVIAECSQPGHALWVRDGSMKVVISCYGSDNAAIMSSER